MQKLDYLLLTTFLLFVCTMANSQIKSSGNTGTFYVAFGTNASLYSKSDIRLASEGSPSFNFTLHNVKGKDDGFFKFKKGSPQYSYQIGYYSHKKNLGIEFTFDHVKYYMQQNQQVQLTGRINGQLMNTDTVLMPGFVQLEHSDGANYAMFKLVRWQPLIKSNQQNTILNLVLKAGAGPVIPKTNSTIMGKHRDDRYKIAGYVIGVEGGLRYHIGRYIYAEFDSKGAFANYKHFLIADGSGSQSWFGLHFAFLLGFQI